MCGSLNVLFIRIIFQIVSGDGAEIHYEVQNIETSGEIDRNRLNLALNLASLIRSPSLTSIDTLTPKEEIDSGKNKIVQKFEIFMKLHSINFNCYLIAILIEFKLIRRR